MIAAAVLGVLYLANRTTKAVGQAVTAADQAVSTGVGAIGSLFGLPTPGETIDDPVRVRYLIDTQGWFYASKWATAGALLKAMNMPAGSGGQVNNGSVSTRTTDPTGMTFNEGVIGSVDPFDPRYYGYQGNIILNAQTNQAGPGGSFAEMGSTANSSAFFSPSNPLGDLSGL